MLLCGFEKFDNFFVRIDILERLFIEIINSSESKSNKIKLVPKMLNLLGCNKESFVKVIKLMGYKVFDEKNETFFKYKPFKKIKKSLDLKIKKDNPFEALKQLDLK